MKQDDEIVRLACLILAADLSAEGESELERGLAQLNAADMPQVLFVSKILEGKPYSFITDNPETVRRSRALAQHVGASIKVIEQAAGITQIQFSPPSRQ